MTTLLVGGCLIAALAAFSQALSGFGFALAAIPLLTLLTGPRIAVVAVTILSCGFTFAFALGQRRQIQWRTARHITFAGLFGMPLGLIAGLLLSSRFLSVLIACVVVGFVVLIHRGVSLRPAAGVTASAGFASGAFLTATGINGPPVVTALHTMNLTPRSLRATLQAIFCAQDLLAIIGFAVVGQLSIHSLVVVAAGAPGMVAGWWVGDRAFMRMQSEGFTRIVLVVLLASAAAALMGAVFDV